MGHVLHVYFMSSNPEFSLSSAERISSFKVEVMARHVLCKWLNHAGCGGPILRGGSLGDPVMDPAAMQG